MSSEQTPLLGSSTRSNTAPTAPAPAADPISDSRINGTVPTSGPVPPARPLSNEDTLTKFRIAIGINVDETNRVDLEHGYRGGPRGLYKEIIKIQRNRYIAYILVESLYYIAILVQMFIGAVLASLGSLPVNHPAAITILGIVNTSTAGIQALLKGQGLPDRLKKDQFEMKKVQDFIEEVEIRLAVAGEGTLSPDELDKVVEQIFQKYNAARDTAEMNDPSSYTHQVDPRPAVGGQQDSAGDGGDGQVTGLKALARTTAIQNGGDAVSARFVTD